MSLFNALLLSLSELFGDVQLKSYARSGVTNNLLSGLAGYVGVIFFLIRSLSQGNILWVNGLRDGISGLATTAFAYIVLGERLKHVYQNIGLGLMGIGLLILNMGGISY